MKNPKLLFSYLFLFLASYTFAQNIEGKIINPTSGLPVVGATVKLLPSDLESSTNASGTFRFFDVPSGAYNLEYTSEGFETGKIPLDFKGTNSTLTLELKPSGNNEATEEQVFGVISVAENDLETDEGDQDVSSILSAGRDPFLASAAYAWGAGRFRTRGLDSEFGSTYVNGIEMNELESGRLYYNQWGGLNDVLRNVHVNYGLMHSEYGIGGLLGNTNINIKAGSQRKGARVSYAVSNRSYRNRLMATYSTGMNDKGWAFYASGSRRWADEGYVDGTFYDAFSYALGLEKQLNKSHSFTFNVMGAPTKRGKASATIDEISDITGNKYYNSYWGYQEGEKRNSRVSNAHQPIFMLGHDWSIGTKSILNTAVSYQFGRNGGTTLNWLKAGNPSADYHQRLPSRIDDPLIRQDVIDNYIDEDYFQVDWAKFYEANRNNPQTVENINGGTESITGNQAKYFVEDRRFDSKEFNFNTVLTHYLTDNNTIHAGLKYQNYLGHNFAVLDDLLGADFHLDIDNFAQPSILPGSDQRDLNNPNAIKYAGDTIGWDFNSNINKMAVWFSDEIKLKKFDFHFGGEFSRSEFWRTGNMRNGYHPDNSFGDSEKQSFTNYTAKAGVTYKLDGRNYFWVNGLMNTKAPFLRNSYINNRNSDQLVPLLESSKTKSLEAGYSFNSPGIRFKLNAYYADIDDLTEINFFYSENATGENDGQFGAYANHNIDKRHVGVEAALSGKISSRVSAKAVAALGQHLYDSRWRHYGFSDVEKFFREDIEVFSNEFFVESSPQKAYNFELKYDSPKFWFATINFNFFQDRYLDFSPERRIAINVADLEGTELREITIQEKVDDFFTLDIFAYKSWKVKDYFIFLTGNVSNILDNRNGISGGYEQLRYNATEGPEWFDTRYYYAYGRNYFIQLGLRF